MKKRLILLESLIVSAALLIVFVVGIFVTRDNNYRQTEMRIKELAAAYADGYRAYADYADVPEGVRVTIVAADGTVIADSEGVDLSSFDNHLTREEIAAAAAGTPKAVTRYSDTLSQEMMYYALSREAESGVVYVRVAVAVGSVEAFARKTVPFTLLALLIALAGAVAAGAFAGKRALAPLTVVRDRLNDLAEGRAISVVPATGDGEIDRMLNDIDEVHGKLRDHMKIAASEREKLAYVIDNVSDGIVVFDAQCEIALINRSAAAIFGIAEATGKSAAILTEDETFLNAVRQCAESGTQGNFCLGIGVGFYQCAVLKTENGLTIAVISDVTAAKNAEKNRSEFFANASHELKTPLTAIKGFNDLVLLNAREDRIVGYARRIEAEAARMLTLIDDMLNLSRLESGAAADDPEEADVVAAAREATESLKPIAAEKGVTVNIEGAGTVTADRKHLFVLIKNLAENGIRYNRTGGHVDIRVEETADRLTLTVRDDGIGVSEEDLPRIFERFYRVDKSRSRETSGTGLGLAIVKHITERYGAALSFESKLGAGTVVRVEFPK